MSHDSNPGGASPKSLYDMYAQHAATTGNPCTMRGLAHDRSVLDENRLLLQTQTQTQTQTRQLGVFQSARLGPSSAPPRPPPPRNAAPQQHTSGRQSGPFSPQSFAQADLFQMNVPYTLCGHSQMLSGRSEFPSGAAYQSDSNVSCSEMQIRRAVRGIDLTAPDAV